MSPKRIQDIDWEPSGTDEAVDQLVPYYTPKGLVDAGRRAEAKNANRAQKMDEVVPEVGAESVGGEETHLGDFLDGPDGSPPKGVHFLYDFPLMKRLAEMDEQDDVGVPPEDDGS